MASSESVGEMELRGRLDAVVRASPSLMTVLRTLRDLNLPDWRIASGAVFQTVWNALTDRPPDHGIKDYDALYFDPDASWEAEDTVIRRVVAAFPPELSAKVEVRNQARVCLWFEAKFGAPYAPLACTDEALERFLTPANALGVRLDPDGRLDIAAPFGLADCFAMRLRPNLTPSFSAANYAGITQRLKARWPEAVVQQP